MEKNIPTTQAIWDEIIAYEKSWLQNHSRVEIPTSKLLDYFGVETICNLYGCKVSNTTIAIELIKEAFKMK